MSAKTSMSDVSFVSTLKVQSLGIQERKTKKFNITNQ